MPPGHLETTDTSTVSFRGVGSQEQTDQAVLDLGSSCAQLQLYIWYDTWSPSPAR